MSANVMVGPWYNSGNPVVGPNNITSGGVVLAVQTMINQGLLDQGLGGMKPISEDGYYGSSTEAAIKAWQANQGLTEDGVVGPNTWQSFWGHLTETYTDSEDTHYSFSANSGGPMKFIYWDGKYTGENNTWEFTYGSDQIYMDSKHYNYDTIGGSENIY